MQGDESVDLSSAAFQFHKGTIRTQVHQMNEDFKRNFNSIKVRLEQIKACTGKSLQDYFNSIKVRLEPTSRPKALPEV